MQRKDKYHLIFTLFEEIHYMSVFPWTQNEFIYLFILDRTQSKLKTSNSV